MEPVRCMTYSSICFQRSQVGPPPLPAPVEILVIIFTRRNLAHRKLSVQRFVQYIYLNLYRKITFTLSIKCRAYTMQASHAWCIAVCYLYLYKLQRTKFLHGGTQCSSLPLFLNIIYFDCIFTVKSLAVRCFEISIFTIYNWLITNQVNFLFKVYLL